MIWALPAALIATGVGVNVYVHILEKRTEQFENRFNKELDRIQDSKYLKFEKE